MNVGKYATKYTSKRTNFKAGFPTKFANIKEVLPQSKSPIYVIDFLNTFSDFREIKYKLLNIDFHKVKHVNKVQDTIDFFELFFTKYVAFAKINTTGNFIFVLKKITNYESTLYQILDLYKDKNIRFIIIESKYNNDILDKNKDDFLCQYILSYLIKKNGNCVLISNDKYRDKEVYVKEFEKQYNNTTIRILKQSKSNDTIDNCKLDINLERIICHNILSQQCERCTVPKNQLKNIL